MTEDAFKLRNNSASTVKRTSLIGNEVEDEDIDIDGGFCILEDVGC